MLFKVEMFGHVVYGQELSYEELLTAENVFQTTATAMLSEAGGEFIHFEAMGDTLRFQCVFEEYDEGSFHAICDALVSYMDGNLEGRLLFVEKNLDNLACYFLAQGCWSESLLQIPVAGPIGATLRKTALKR